MHGKHNSQTTPKRPLVNFSTVQHTTGSTRSHRTIVMGLNVFSQSFLQWLMAERVLTTSEAIKRFNLCVDNAGGREASKIDDIDGLQHQVDRINSQMEFVEFQIKNMYSPWDDLTYWCLCNTIEDEASRVGTHLSKAEVEVFYAIMDELREFAGEMDLVEAQHVTTQRSIPVAETGRIIQKLSQGQWLKIARHNGGEATVTPGPRAIVELPAVRQWVREIGREMRQNGKAGSHGTVEKGEDEEVQEAEDDDGEVVRRGRKRRGREASSDAMETDEVQVESGRSRRGSQPRAVRRGARRSGR